MNYRHVQESTTTAPCPVFRDCTIVEPGHHDHIGCDRLKVADTHGEIVEAGMVAVSDSAQGAVVFLRDAEFGDAAAVRAKTAELREFLDEVDALADRVFADQQERLHPSCGTPRSRRP